MAGATPTLTSVKANVLDSGADREVGRRDEAEAAGPGVPVHAGDDRDRALDHGR